MWEINGERYIAPDFSGVVNPDLSVEEICSIARDTQEECRNRIEACLVLLRKECRAEAEELLLSFLEGNVLPLRHFVYACYGSTRSYYPMVNWIGDREELRQRAITILRKEPDPKLKHFSFRIRIELNDFTVINDIEKRLEEVQLYEVQPLEKLRESLRMTHSDGGQSENT